jgi:hydrogenase maturation protease
VTRATPHTAVVGVGNPTMGDDGVGKEVIERLDTSASDGDVAVDATFTGTTGFFALEAMDGSDRAVIVDAVDVNGPPGSVHRFRLDRGSEAEGAVPEVTLHDVSFRDALRSCRSAYDLPERVVLVGVVPAEVTGRLGLSEAVSAAVPTAAAAVRAELGRRARHERGAINVDATWYCQDCEKRIDAAAVDDHEARGHSVRGRLRPDRLLAQDPWETGDEEAPD